MYDVYVMARDPLMRLGVRQLISGDERIRTCVALTGATDPPTAPPAGAAGAAGGGRSAGGSDADTVVIMVAPLTNAMRRACARFPSLVMVPESMATIASAAVRAGAHAVVTTGTSPAQMRVALDVVASGGLYLCSELSERYRRSAGGRAPGAALPGAPPALAPREVETLELIAGGLTHAETARRLGLAESTVNAYLARIRSKLDADTKAELIRKAIAFGLVQWNPPITSGSDDGDGYRPPQAMLPAAG
jgi:DNA-binding NarL/FixJ family response regulator